MPLEWDDLFFEEKADQILSMFELTDAEREEIQSVWSEQVFEIDMPVFRAGNKAILDGRKSALSALQTLCEEYIMRKTGVRDRRKELVQRRNK